MDAIVWLRQYKLPVFLGILSLLSIGVSAILFSQSIPQTKPIEFSSDTTDTSASTSAIVVRSITVDVEGAVVQPGVYSLPEGSRVEDAIAAAGGLHSEADLQTISQTVNRAAKVLDGGKLYFSKKGEVSGVSSKNTDASLVSVNNASQSELEALPGVGPVTAGKIIQGRPYQLLEELVSKKAVGQSLFEKIRNQLSL